MDTVSAIAAIPGQNARVTFGGTAGQQINLGVSGGTFGSTYALSLLRPDGTVLASSNGNNYGNNGVAFNTLTLPSSGLYTLLLDPYGPDTGSIAVSLP